MAAICPATRWTSFSIWPLGRSEIHNHCLFNIWPGNVYCMLLVMTAHSFIASEVNEIRYTLQTCSIVLQFNCLTRCMPGMNLVILPRFNSEEPNGLENLLHYIWHEHGILKSGQKWVKTIYYSGMLSLSATWLNWPMHFSDPDWQNERGGRWATNVITTSKVSNCDI